MLTAVLDHLAVASVGNNTRKTYIVLPRLGNSSIVLRILVYIAIILVILVISYYEKYYQAYITSIITHTGRSTVYENATQMRFTTSL
jgi:hypothetical protein